MDKEFAGRKITHPFGDGEKCVILGFNTNSDGYVFVHTSFEEDSTKRMPDDCSSTFVGEFVGLSGYIKDNRIF